MYLYEAIREEEPEESPAFENLMVNIFCFCIFVTAIYFFCKILDAISEYRQKKRYEAQRKHTYEDALPSTQADMKAVPNITRDKTQQYTYVQEKICVEERKEYDDPKAKERVEREIKKCDEALEFIYNLMLSRAKKELETGTMDRATWATAIMLSNGDEKKAKEEYIKLRTDRFRVEQ